MPTTASIKINGGTAGLADTNLPINATVDLTNNDDTGVVSHEWVILSQPAGAQDSWLGSAPPSITTTADAPQFTPTKEGSYLIRLTVNKGLADEASDTTICAVRELLTGDRIPAPQETTEVSDTDGWATAAVTKILQRVTRLSDAGIFVAQNDSGGALVLGKVVHMNGMTTIGNGDNERPIPTVDLALASDPAKVDGPLGVVVGNRDGENETIEVGDLCRVMVMGGIPSYNLGASAAAGATVYVDDTGTLSLTAGTVVRQVGDVAKDLGGNLYDIAISAGANSIPRGNAGGDLTGAYPDPTVIRINGTTVDAATSTAVGNVLRLTGVPPTDPAADWGPVDLANTNAVTGALSTENGGTGQYLLPNSGGIAYGTAANKLDVTAAGTLGYLLTSGGAGAPSWIQTVPLANGGTNNATLASAVTYGVIYKSATNLAATAAPSAVGQVLRHTATGPAFGAVDLADTDAVTGTLPVNRGGTGQSSGLTAGGVVYASSSSAMTSTAAGTDDRVLVGGFGAGPTWNYVPTGAFASASVPIYALQGAALIFTPGSPTYSNNTTTFTNLVTGTGTLSAGMVTFHITAKDDGSDFYTQLTSATNNHNVRVLLKFLVTGPSGFSKTYQYSYYSSAASAAGQLVGSFSFPVIAFLAPTGGSYTFTAQAAVDTNGDSVQVGDYRFYAYQG